MVLMGREFGRRTVAIFWCAVIGIVSAVLIYLEMIPILYVLATLALVVLLLVVAFSDLENVGRDAIDG
jgi:choline-glycine betaine transporter